MGIKLQPAAICYVPPTRATMHALGRPVTAEIGDQTIALPLTEMPGEIDWRADHLLWFMRFTMFHFAMMSPEERDGRFEKAMQELVLESQLHPIAARAVAELALQSATALSDKQVASLKARLVMYLKRMETEWTSLSSSCREQRK